MQTVLAFLVALGVLIAFHEWGHYRVAVACGVRVIRFSLGFGPVLLRWKSWRPRPGQDTEFVLCAIPLGGYVRMLDESDGNVPPHELSRAFNRQSLGRRAAIVAAGPGANFLLALVLYTGVAWYGVREPAPVLGAPVQGSLAEQAGLEAGDTVRRVRIGTADPIDVSSFETLRSLLVRGVVAREPVVVELERGTRGRTASVSLDLTRLGSSEPNLPTMRRVGIVAPYSAPVLGELVTGGPAERAGLRKGDRVLRVGDKPIADSAQLRESIRNATPLAAPQVWMVQRADARLEVPVQVQAVSEGGRLIGRIQAYVGAPPDYVTVKRGLVDGPVEAAAKVWETSWLSLKLLGQMLIGEASLRNLSGPLTIAEYAGKTAEIGIVQYLLFLAVISVSLGVLNLLPVPVLDGGHLMYYLWDAVTGRSVSEIWLERMQRGGLALLLVVMFIALFNDVTRLFG